MFEEDDFEESPEQTNEIRASHVKRYEDMLQNKENFFFDADVLNNIADYYLEQDENGKALEAIRFGLKLHPGIYWFMLREASILSRMSNHALALEKLNFFELIHPTDSDFFIIKAHVLGNMEKFEEALYNFKKALELTDEKEAIYHDMAFLYNDLGDYENAITYMKTYIRSGNDEIFFYDQLIQWYLLIQKPEECVAFLNERIDFDPYNNTVWMCLATLYKEMKQYVDALHAIEYSLLIQENNVNAHIEKGDICFLLKEYSRALVSYQAALELTPNHAITLYNIAQCFENLDNFEAARHHYQAAVKAQPDLDEAWYAIGALLTYNEKWYDAIHYFKKAIENNNANAEYWFALGDCESNLFHFKEAKACYENVIELEPSNEDIWIEYSMLLYDNNFIDEAVATIQTGIKTLPDKPEFYYYLTAYLYAAGLIKESYLELEKAIEMDKDGYPLIFEISSGMKNDPYVRNLIGLKN